MTTTRTYTATSTDGSSYCTVTATAAEEDAFYTKLSDFFNAGVARFGNVAAFQNAMEAYVAIHAAERAAA